MPRAYQSKNTGKYSVSYNNKYPYDWNNTTITRIIKNRVYLGHMVNNKSTTKSYKNRKIISIPEEEWIEVKNTHEAIIDEETWELAQKTIGKRKRPMKSGEIQIFSGLVKCSTCGGNISLLRQNDRKGNGSFACNKARKKGKEYCTFHYISYDNLYKAVLEDIQFHSKAAEECREEFIQNIMDLKFRSQKEKYAKNVKEIEKAKVRIGELENIICRLYEDDVNHKISDERFIVLLKKYEDEELTLKNNIEFWEEDIKDVENAEDKTKLFADCVKKYIDIKELTVPILNELIEKIVVYDAEKIDGKRIQKIEIFYRFIGTGLSTT